MADTKITHRYRLIRQAILPTAAVALVLSWGNTGAVYGQVTQSPTTAPNYLELQRRVKTLEAENQQLQARNKELEQQQQQPAPDAAPEQTASKSETPSVRNVADDDGRYQFLKLGEKKDYLKAERWRIVDQIQQAIPPLYEPVRPFHGYTLPPGVWRLGLDTTYMRNNSDFGSDEFYSKFFNNVDLSRLDTNLNIFYGFELGPIHDLTANLSIPYSFGRIHGTGHPFRIDPMTMTMNGSGDGLGDMSLTIKKKWMDQGNGPFTFSTITGVIFPTSEDEKEFDASQTVFVNGQPMPVSANVPGSPSLNIFGRKPNDRFLPRSAQPGNGSWGARLGFAATYQFERSAIHGGAVYDLLADNDGITPGDELRYGISYVFPPTPSDLFTVDLSVFGMWKGDEKFPGKIMHAERDPATGGPVMNPDGSLKMFLTDRPDFKHGNILFFSPSLIFLPTPNTRVFISPAVRLMEPDEGPSPAWTVSVGTTVTF